MRRQSRRWGYTLVKIKAGAEQQTIAAIKNLYTEFNHGLNFNYSFLDDDYNRLYASGQRVAVLSKYFAGIAILISCLGLFGLAAFTNLSELPCHLFRKIHVIVLVLLTLIQIQVRSDQFPEEILKVKCDTHIFLHYINFLFRKVADFF
jgi:hypothetical protein